ncbi:BA75_04147T0 [Komagataella pastoris]|uniref:BA75_04147T0 n=1 Tax=Komagataella pastoris TaxID=4922 RepID=A0A1B2JFN4_PICPA|nr:BA75_04147T0 [Komagataella pastoris]
MPQPLEQQQVALFLAMRPENIFNSESSALAYSTTPYSSSVHPVTDVNGSFLFNSDIPNDELFFVDSTTDTSFEHAIQCLLSYRMSPSSALPSVELPTTIASSTLLEVVVDSKRQECQLAQQNAIDNLNCFHNINMPAPRFLNYSSFPLVRGFCSAGKMKPPKKRPVPGTEYVSVHLELSNSSYEDMCLPKWNELELEDGRRIIRIEKRRQFNEIEASFSIVGSALENPHTRLAFDTDVDVLEVSCLICPIKKNRLDTEQSVLASSSNKEEHYMKLLRPDLKKNSSNCIERETETSVTHKFYITSVEVIKIVEFLTENRLIQDSKARRQERSCVRSNLKHFWSKYLVSSSSNTMSRGSKPAYQDDCIEELARRIRAYEVRRPRTVDKSVRILEWSKLRPALKRALQSYYVAVPLDKFETSFKKQIVTKCDYDL